MVQMDLSYYDVKKIGTAMAWTRGRFNGILGIGSNLILVMA